MNSKLKIQIRNQTRAHVECQGLAITTQYSKKVSQKHRLTMNESVFSTIASCIAHDSLPPTCKVTPELVRSKFGDRLREDQVSEAVEVCNKMPAARAAVLGRLDNLGNVCKMIPSGSILD